MKYIIYLKKKDGKIFQKEGIGHNPPVYLEEFDFKSELNRLYKLIDTKIVGFNGNIESVTYKEQ